RRRRRRGTREGRATLEVCGADAARKPAPDAARAGRRERRQVRRQQREGRRVAGAVTGRAGRAGRAGRVGRGGTERTKERTQRSAMASAGRRSARLQPSVTWYVASGFSRTSLSGFSRTFAFCAAIVLLCTTAARAAADARLADAVEKMDRAAVRQLVAQRADVNAPQADGMTALHWAVYRDDVETASLLVRAGATVKAANRYRVM